MTVFPLPLIVTPFKGAVTRRVMVAMMEASVGFSGIAMITTSPGAFAVTVPSLSTVAVLSDELLHLTFLFVALSGLTEAVKGRVLPVSILSAVF